MERLVVATRRSALALAQARAWMRELSERYPDLTVEELHVVTTGDQVQDRALSEIGGKGLFIKEIEEALLDGRADLAVHSLKDVPAELAPSLAIGCVPLREDPRDAVVTRDGRPLAELPAGARIGTSSLRRRVQLAAWRPDLEFLALRGNVDTRLRKCREGEVEAVILARAGLLRLGLADEITEVLEPERCLPAVGQGALAIEIRAGDDRVLERIAPLAHAETALMVEAERGVMVAVDGSCQVPVAGYAIRDGGQMLLRAMLAEPDGSRARRREVRAAWPANAAEARALGVELGRALRAG
ncbi:MAG: hydroxymethylbilane synthase [Sorangiineae bacterium]|nr:hydroxymethylbilane synthase [Polyangiaceae bacterium]MEB2321679.1 hydroxymethylbilane synthase [Sorangiineae bacterium]